MKDLLGPLGTNPLLQDVMNQPEEARLTYALGLINALSGWIPKDLTYFLGMGLSKLEAQTASILNNSYGKIVSREMLCAAMFPNRGHCSRVVDNAIVAIRKVFPDWVYTHHKSGWTATYQIDIPELQIEVQPVDWKQSQSKHYQPWSEDDLAELQRMFDNGSEVWAIADELGRTERAVDARLRELRKLHPRQARALLGNPQ